MKANAETKSTSTDEWLRVMHDLQTRQLQVLRHIRARVGIIATVALILFLCLFASVFFFVLAQLP